MNAVSPKKLLHSKWTAAQPRNREKHVLVVDVLHDEADVPRRCVIEAVHNGRQIDIDWRDLKDPARWRIGWV